MSWNEIGFNNTGDSGEKKTEYLKLEGTVKVRILDDEPRTYWTHWVPQMNGGKGGSINCIGKGCPICAMMAQDKKENKPKRYSSSKKHIINVIDRATGTVKLLNAGETVFEGLKQIMMQMGDLKSYDVSITRAGTGKQTKYSVLPTFPPKPLTDEEKQLEKYDLDTVNKPLTGEQIEMLLEGKSYKEIFAKPEDEVVDFAEGVE